MWRILRRLRAHRPAGSYTTTFPLTENPISEGGAWTHTDPTTTNVKTEAISGVHVAHGSQVGGPFSPFDDSQAFLSGFGANQSIQGTIYKVGGSDTNVQEVELLLRYSDGHASFDPGGGFGNTTVQGYEINISRAGGYMNLGQFKGPLIAQANPSPASVQQIGRAPADGDVFKVQIVGMTITAYWNGTPLTWEYPIGAGNAVTSVTIAAPDWVWTTGNPGIGFYADGFPNSQFGFKSITATTL